ncbi:MAG: nicotinamide mononucleotide transporter [Clostridia bacterium]|nr:nicotinamide mononucleotide transporter [Clostridia bacterium]
MKSNKKADSLTKKDIFIIVLMCCTAVLITVTAIHNKQNFLQILPLYVSLIIGMLQSRVSRFASMLGSVNSLLYGAVYIHFNLYGSALSAIFFSCPIQALTFIRWNKHKSGHSTVLRRMTTRQRLLLLPVFAVVLAAMWFVLPLLGSEYVFLDSVTTLLGIVIYFFTMFAYVEYTALMLVNGAIGIALYLQVLGSNPEIATHLIFSVYSFICVIFAFFEAKRLYKTQQQAEKELKK